MEDSKVTKQRGRPPEFDHEQALEKALEVFWSRGYEGASMAELTEALGINRPSIYAAFGNKEELFRKALKKYASGPVAYVQEALAESTAYQAVERFLKQSADVLTSQTTPRGCLIVQGALTGGEGSQLIQQELAGYRKKLEQAFKQRFQLAQSQAELPGHIDVSVLAKYVAMLHQGISVQATSGTSKEELLAVIDMALACWPGTK